MAGKGTIRGSHHLTYCTGGAQEDYDFHVRVLGLKSIKKTVLFDGELPIYHLYYANKLESGGFSTVLTSFPYRQQGWKGKRGTNQTRQLNLAVPVDSIGYWADRLRSHNVEVEETELFGTQRLVFHEPSGISFALVGAQGPAVAESGGDVPAEHAIHGAWGTTIALMDPEPMDYFLTKAFGGRKLGSEGRHHQYEIGTDEGAGRRIELLEESGPQGSWWFGEGTIHHHAFDVISADNQAVVKDWIVGLGFTDVSDVKDRGYFFSVYLRTPSGALFELAYSTPQGFLIDESEDELGTHMCIPPHWEHRRDEIAQLEPINTDEAMVGVTASDAAPETRGGQDQH
ncbi:MAG TPA: hypothetical protein VN213_07275 [Solirubrobacteraceae bacterium]|nr:hypothetical protein [Solirubrobacteraceae bacterium]